MRPPRVGGYVAQLAGEDWGSPELERRRSRQVARNLHYPHGPHGRARHRARDPRRQPPLPRRRGATTTTPSGASTYGEVGAAQVLGKLSKLLGAQPGPYARSLEIGAGTGYFSLNLLKAGVVGDATCTDISPGMLETLEANARTARPGGRDRRLRRRRAAVRGRLVRPRARPRRAAPPARARALVRRVRARAAPRRDAVLRRRAVAPGRSHRRLAEARRDARRAAVAARGAARDRGVGRSNGGAPSPADAEHALESVVDVHAFDPARPRSG